MLCIKYFSYNNIVVFEANYNIILTSPCLSVSYFRAISTQSSIPQQAVQTETGPTTQSFFSAVYPTVVNWYVIMITLCTLSTDIIIATSFHIV